MPPLPAVASPAGPPSVVGLDIGGTKTAVVEGGAGGEILQRRAFPTEAERPFEETFPRLAAAVDETREAARTADRHVAALSVSIGGPLRIGDGVLIDPPHLPGWHGVPLKERLEARFPGLPVFVEHDGNAGALAELHFGVGRTRPDLQHLIFLTFGTGIGGGVIVHRRVLHGASDTAGEIGHWRLAEDGPVGFGKAGSWEGFASGRGLVRLAARRFPDRWTPEGSIRAFVDAVLAADPQAIEVAAEAGRWMGRGLALLVDAFNPEVIVLGSLAVVLGDRVLGPARAVLAEEALPQAVAACEILPAILGDRLGDTAALMAAFVAPGLRSVFRLS